MKKRKATRSPVRRSAKAATGKRKAEARPSVSRIQHELDVHRFELEVQNEELRAARQLTETALARYTEVFDFAPIGFATLDFAGSIREINHAGAKLLGAERNQFAGKPFKAYVAAHALSSFEALLLSASLHSSTSHELDLQRAGAIFPARITIAVVGESSATLMLALEDITERRTKEAELARTEAALRDLNRRKDEFLAILSHELRNPLSPIRTSVAVLEMAPPGSREANEAIGIIDRSTTHMSRLVDDLLDVTRITRGKIELKREVVDMRVLITQTLDAHRATFTKRRFEIATRLDPTALWVHADPERLVQVLSNVLGNAEKFTPVGGRISLTLDREDGAAIIRIADTGIGIPPDIIGDVFTPFAQGPQSLDRRHGGLGLGLVMVKSLVELHGGRVAIRSGGLGQGTEVVIALPCVMQHGGTRTAALAQRTLLRRILVVEDLMDTAHSLQQALLLKGHDVKIALDGWSGLRELMEQKPDVVLCDIGLPDMDGFAFAMRVRAEATFNATYLIALSGYARAEDVARAKAAGFDRHLAKPVDLAELDRLLAQLPIRDGAHNPPEHNTLH